MYVYVKDKLKQNKTNSKYLSLKKNISILIDLSDYMLSVQCLKFIMAIGIIIYS